MLSLERVFRNNCFENGKGYVLENQHTATENDNMQPAANTPDKSIDCAFCQSHPCSCIGSNGYQTFDLESPQLEPAQQIQESESPAEDTPRASSPMSICEDETSLIFAQFNKLPPKIRNLIWSFSKNLVLFPSEPAAITFFSVSSLLLLLLESKTKC